MYELKKGTFLDPLFLVDNNFPVTFYIYFLAEGIGIRAVAVSLKIVGLIGAVGLPP